MKKLYLFFVLSLSVFLPSFAQQITGKVVDGSASPLPGVSVTKLGSTSGTITDNEGNYSIAASRGDQLTFSFIGMIDQTLTVGNGTVLNVTLESDAQQLDEVVITALGISRDKKSLGYATQEVDGDKLTLANSQNVIGTLSGRIAGVQVTGSSAANMGGTQKIKIRGVNSIGGGDQPLIVVDGTPISNANFSGADNSDLGNLSQDVNPADIESVNVLKGPAASALYGIRGQYGVIMITTKKGKKGPKDVQVQLNSAYTLEQVYNIMPTQNLYGAGASQTFRTLPNGDPYVDMSYDESWGPKMDGTPVRQVFSFYPQDPDYGKLTPFVPHPNNIRDFYDNGTNFNNSLTVSGGNENTTYRFSFNDTRIKGVVPNTKLNRNNVGLNASMDLAKNLSLETNVNYARNSGQRPKQGSEYGAGYMVQWFERNLDMNRLRNYQYADGTYLHWNLSRPSSTGEIANLEPLYWDNPFFDAYENLNTDNRDRVYGNMGLKYTITPDLSVSGNVRTDFFTQNIEERFAFGGRHQPYYSIGKYQNKEMNYELLAQYNKNINDFSISGTVGGNIYDRDYSYLSMATVGGLSALDFYNIDASIDRPATTSYSLQKQIRSAYALASLGYKDTYFVDATIRNDNSSTLPAKNNSYWYPSISGSIIFSELMDFEALSFGKLRASYAKAGSDLSPYSISQVYGVGTVYGNVNTLYVPDNLNNANIKPSFSNSTEFGLDLRFFHNRLGLDLTYYQQRNENQIIQLDVSGTSGYNSSTINAGLIENKGWELALTAKPIKSNNFNWDMNFNINHNKSMVVRLAEGIDVYAYDNTVYSSVSSYLNSYVGKPFGSLIGQAYQRDEATGKILLGSDNMPLYTDATHDFGTVLPKFNGGFQNILTYKQWTLAAMIDFQGGGQFFSRSKMLAVRTGQDPITVAINDQGHNVRDDVEDGGGVKVTGISAETGQEITAYVDARSYYRNVVGRRIYEEWLFDASYIRLQEVRLGYTFSKATLGKLPVKSANVSFIARSPFMIWQNAPKGINPAEITRGSKSISWYESGQLPSVRSYGINLNITF
ncbi:SusC/RagA family TonB-linked outer membrane protein [Marinilongibacter aquaticus]|uniref:SusC/RagA family TonB-linked outer membrane protein n=1 Tax=Marinilongibacter aquaticus TaxID=2975157 RepID=UPI0021BD6F10|nr:SusC/RagA family TonB-linked outer membrane protein [Marinilongibacter aquaticus]UBM59058.1 SusC/RagA family TonB-linked outer membrane protein [Marinilongibacter aquaticus]